MKTDLVQYQSHIYAQTLITKENIENRKCTYMLHDLGTLFPLKQWAAVNTYLLLMSTPPQIVLQFSKNIYHLLKYLKNIPKIQKMKEEISHLLINEQKFERN